MGHALVRMPCTFMHLLWFYPVSIGPPHVCTPFVPHAYWNSATSNFAILLPSSRPPPKERSLPLDATNRYKAHTHLVSGSSRLAATGASSSPPSLSTHYPSHQLPARHVGQAHPCCHRLGRKGRWSAARVATSRPCDGFVGPCFADAAQCKPKKWCGHPPRSHIMQLLTIATVARSASARVPSSRWASSVSR